MKIFAFVAACLFMFGSAIGDDIYVPDDYATIGDAIDAAAHGDTVIVRPGTYLEWDIRFGGKVIHLKSSDGPEVTILDGYQHDAVFTVRFNEGPNTIIEGFTITNGRDDGNIECEETSPTIANNIIRDNPFGPGLKIHKQAYPLIYNNIITGNEGFNGGGIACFGSSSPTISNNVISHNSAESHGGGIYSGGGAPKILNNRITDNHASDGGGIFHDSEDAPAIKNNIIARNTVSSSASGDGLGGGLFIRRTTDPKFSNNTIVANFAEIEGGGLFCHYETKLTVSNSIFWDNDSPLGPEIGLEGYTKDPYPFLTIEYSNVKGGQNSVFVGLNCVLYWMAGMIDADPLFADGANGDFHLTYPSPCVDSGLSTVPGLPNKDFEGDPRIALGNVDMGADEFYYHLYHSGDVVPGSQIDLKVVGFPSAPVVLYLGSQIADPPYSTQHGDFHLSYPALWHGNIGRVAGDGLLVFPATVPSSWTSGSEHPLQALVGPWGGSWTKFTNAEVLTVE